jgi:hypothetical protein
MNYRPSHRQRCRDNCPTNCQGISWNLKFSQRRLEVISIFFDITCSPMKIKRRFGGRYCFHFQGQRSSWSRQQAVPWWLSPEDTAALLKDKTLRNNLLSRPCEMAAGGKGKEGECCHLAGHARPGHVIHTCCSLHGRCVDCGQATAGTGMTRLPVEI